MKVLIYLSLIFSTIWSYLAFPYNLASPIEMLVGVYKYQLPSVTWTVAIIYIYDFIMAMLKRNSSYMIEFHQSLKVEFITLFALFAFTCCMYVYTPMKFTESTVDISMAGFGFLVFGNIGVFRLFSFTVGDVRYPKKIAFFLSCFSIVTSAYFLYLTLSVARGGYSLLQSLWIQLTVLSYSVSLYFVAKHICFYMEKGRLGVSPVLLSILKNTKGMESIYSDLASGVDIWNKEAEKARAKRSKRLRGKINRKK